MASDLDRAGAVHLPKLILGAIEEWDQIWLASKIEARAGKRLYDLPAMSSAIDALISNPELGDLLGAGEWRCVRALALNKSPRSNWALGWHQDRVIAVREQGECEGFENWTEKSGILHVCPPVELHAAMRTLRLHLDPVGPKTGQLLFIPGSHDKGRFAEAEIAMIARTSAAAACPAERGDGWLYATPILHSSKRATLPSQRRVIQLDFAPCDLPEPLEWLRI